mgnify:FL=1
MRLLTSGTETTFNLYSGAYIYLDGTSESYTNTGSNPIRISVYIQTGNDAAGLNGSGNLTFKPIIKPNTHDNCTMLLEVSQYTISAFYHIIKFDGIILNENDFVSIYVQSSNSSDTSVGCKGWVYDINDITTINGSTPLSAGDVADAILDEPIIDHTTTGTVGECFNEGVSAPRLGD